MQKQDKWTINKNLTSILLAARSKLAVYFGHDFISRIILPNLLYRTIQLFFRNKIIQPSEWQGAAECLLNSSVAWWWWCSFTEEMFQKFVPNACKSFRVSPISTRSVGVFSEQQIPTCRIEAMHAILISLMLPEFKVLVSLSSVSFSRCWSTTMSTLSPLYLAVPFEHTHGAQWFLQIHYLLVVFQ